MQDLVTVFGGSGFVGRQVVRALARAGWRVRVAVRNPHLAQDLRLCGDVGQVQLTQANIRNEASVKRALDGATACVNLVGVLYETGAKSFEATHAEGARTIAAAAKAAGVTRFVQMSALGADAASPAAYARSKAQGEVAVRKVFPNAMILRPSVIFGPGDGIFERFAKMAVISPALPLIGGGATKFQPVFVGDVAKAIARLLADFDFAGHTFELAGPETLTFRQILEVVRAETQRSPVLVPLPFFAAGLIGKLGDLMAFVLPPPLTSDQVEMLKVDNIAGGDAPGLAELGVAPTTVGSVVGGYLFRYRPGGQYAENLKRAAPAA